MSKKNNTTKNTSKKNKNISKTKNPKKIDVIESSLNEKIKELELSVQQQKDKNIRLLAELDNFKRRTRDEKNHLIRYSGEEIILSLLPVLDDMQRTVDNIENTDEESVKEAIQLVQVKLSKILKEKAIEPLQSIGEKFDPDYHEALMSEPGEEEDMILKELECGYKYHDRIIRHAKVVVSKID